MKKLAFLILLFILTNFLTQPAIGVTASMDTPEYKAFWDSLQPNINRHLRRPYIWGASGLKSFDCSGFVWRVMYDSGVLIKRTTARKFYLSLPAVEQDQKYRPGNIVFFDDLKHCGIVSDGQKFYHARSSKGTTLDSFDHYWSPKVTGFRAIPVPNISRQ